MCLVWGPRGRREPLEMEALSLIILQSEQAHAAPCKGGNFVITAIAVTEFCKYVMLIMQTGENSEISSSRVSSNGNIMRPTATLYSNNVISPWLVDKRGPTLSIKQNCCARLYLGDK